MGHAAAAAAAAAAAGSGEFRTDGPTDGRTDRTLGRALVGATPCVKFEIASSATEQKRRTKSYRVK